MAPDISKVRTSATTLAGQPAVRLDYITTARDPRYIMAPGFRRIYVVRDGADIVTLYLTGPDTARADQLMDEIVKSVTLR